MKINIFFFFFINREFKFGDSVEDQQVGCLWQNNHVLTVSLSGRINYINVNAPAGDNDFLIRVLKGHSKSITALECVGSSHIFSASHDGLIIHWNPDTGDMDSIKTTSIGGHTNQVQGMSYDNFSNSIVTCGIDDVIKFIDIGTFSFVNEIKLNSQPQAIDTGFNGISVIACINQLVLVRNREKIGTFNIDYEATSVSIAIGINHVAVGGKDRKVHIYELKVDNSLVEIKTIEHRDFITSVRYSNDPTKYLAVADNAKYVKCYQTADKEYKEITRDLWQHHAGTITQLSWSPDSSHLATSSVDTHCIIYLPSNVSGYIQIKSKFNIFYLLKLNQFSLKLLF
jgi:WD repeat-containing protein 1 (actin-interacting protein 1)